MESFAIRAAEGTDVAALAELAKRTWADAFGQGLSHADLDAELEAGRSEAYFTRALHEKTILLAENADGLVGYVQFGDVGIPEVERQSGDQELQRLYVDTAMHGRGVGRALMDAALCHPRLAAADRIFLQVWERNERAVRLYESHGFRRMATTAFVVGQEVMEDLVMVRDQMPGG